ncbi:hypothetical protein [Nocardioides sp.]|uniref:hypothetical protein n=1 Tax=Nocardioides sp. TaxID=35761 RepID=UPI003D09E231
MTDVERRRLRSSGGFGDVSGPWFIRGSTSTIHVAVDRQRSLVAPSGVRLHRVVELGARVQWNLSPPRVRYDDAVLDLAADADSDLKALGVVVDACNARRTTAGRLLERLEGRRRIARRRWLTTVLSDIVNGLRPTRAA